MLNMRQENDLSELVLKEFQVYSAIYKSSQDKYERLFKLRRDVTIESKRVIFLLHSIDKDCDRNEKLKEAKKRLNEVKSSFYKQISVELDGVDPYKYFRAISPGNQEYIEAATFLNFLETGDLVGPVVCEDLPFAPLSDYALGVADLTGELMRHCITSIGIRAISNTNAIRSTIREIYRGMLLLPPTKELDDKFPVIKSNTCKVERVCYNLHIMGNEIPKHFDLCLDKHNRVEDEG